MKYKNIVGGVFLARPNRFIARVLADGQETTAHVKNTGRCRELLIPGARVVLEKSDNPRRKTALSLIGVYKGERLVNMDSQAPNQAAFEWAENGADGLFGQILGVKREKTYGHSRFDLYLETEEGPWFMEVKGVTLFDGGTARFPDAPTQRGLKHVEELAACCQAGYGAAILFVIQTRGMDRLEPNWETHREFGRALLRARQAGVRILAYDCRVKENEMVLNQPIAVDLEEKPGWKEEEKCQIGK